MTVDLSGVQAKLKRAHEHRNALEREITPILDGERHQIKSSAEYYPDADYYVFRVAELPVEWRMRVALILGDLVHSLRSALEQLAWQLVLSHSGRPSKPREKTSVEFPIKFRSKALRSTYIYSKVSPSDRAILNSVQPYSGAGNPKLHGLAIIQQLSNRDKHRLLNPILLQSKTFGVWHGESERVFFDIFSFQFLTRRKNLKIVTEIVACRLVGIRNEEMDVTGYSAPTVCLPQGPDVSLMEGVDVMIRTVESIVKKFAAQYGV